MKGLGISFILSALLPLYLGLDKILHYSNPQSITLDPTHSYITSEELVNAYVGGDAYNFIINSNYFTGYMVMALILVLIGSTILICNEINQLKKVKEIEIVSK